MGFNLKDIKDKAKKALEDAQPYLDLAKAEAASLKADAEAAAKDVSKAVDKKLQELTAPEAPAKDDKGFTDGPNLGKPDMSSKHDVLKDFFSDEGTPAPDKTAEEKTAKPKARKPRAPKNKPGV